MSNWTTSLKKFIKLMRKNLFACVLTVLLVFLALPLMAQERDKTINITVTCNTGESLLGQAVSVKQTEYGLSYAGVKLDAQGKATVKAYAGPHTVTVERTGYNTATTSFSIGEDEAVKNITLQLTEKMRTPFALDAHLAVDAYTAAKTLTVTWNTEKPAFYDDFESYEPFAINFGDWTGIDGDQLSAAALQGDYANRGVRQYAQIMNPLTVEPMWYYDYPVLRAYEGKQYVGFTRTGSGEANDDWLISPEITVGTDNVLSFMAKAADKYLEKFVVYITTQTDNPAKADFKQLTTGNYESVDYKWWHEMQYDLSSYAGKKVKIAIRYIGDANLGGAFMLMVDDFYVGQINTTEQAAKAAQKLTGKAQRMGSVPALSPANPNEVFDVYFDDQLVGTTSGYTYTLENVADGVHTYGVRARYKATTSELVRGTIDVNNTGYAHLVFNVTADSKATADGQKINMLSVATGDNYAVTVADGKADIKALPAGQYIINIQKGAFKEYSLKTDITTDRSFDIALEDNVEKPYNITADLTHGDDGKTNASLKWNQLLGFSDSFESYDDFASESFGDWLSYDDDVKAVYPISLNGTVIDFPGASTPSDPQPVPPMVFNPWKTTPAMLPADPAMYAPDGDKYVIFFSPQGAKADKWLISPLINVYDGFELKATAKSYSDMYPETIEFAVSEDGSDNPDDFTAISTAANMPSDRWTEYSTPLDAYVGRQVRVAIHYVSYDTFFAQVDNVKVEPKDGGGLTLDYGNVVKYVIYLDGKKIGESTTPSYVLTGLTEGNHTIGVEAVYKNATSEMATYEIVVSGIGTVKADAMPVDAQVFTLSGQKVNGDVKSLPRGVYVVKSASGVMKVRK